MHDKKIRKPPWRCRMGIHAWGATQHDGLATLRDTCTRCGLERYFHALINETFYRRARADRIEGAINE